MNLPRIAMAAFILGCLSLTSACVVAERDNYREGYYDHEHHRWWHEHQWHECEERDEHCH